MTVVVSHHSYVFGIHCAYCEHSLTRLPYRPRYHCCRPSPRLLLVDLKPPSQSPWMLMKILTTQVQRELYLNGQLEVGFASHVLALR